MRYIIEIYKNSDLQHVYKAKDIEGAYELASRFSTKDNLIAIIDTDLNLTIYFEDGKTTEYEVVNESTGSLSFKDKDTAVEYANSIKILNNRDHIEYFNSSFERKDTCEAAWYINVKTIEAANALKFVADLDQLETPYFNDNYDSTVYSTDLIGKFIWNENGREYIHIESTIKELNEVLNKF